MTTAPKTGYALQGDLIEACSCSSPCPCWVSADPDEEYCWTFIGYHITSGTIRDIDVSKLSLVSLIQSSGNMTSGQWREVVFVDAKASSDQYEALLDAFQGRLGGDLAGLAALVSERVATYSVEIEYEIVDGKGSFRVGVPKGEGYAVDFAMEPYRGPNGKPTQLVNAAYSGVLPIDTAFVGKATQNTVSVPQHGMEWSYPGRNATNGQFVLRSK